MRPKRVRPRFCRVTRGEDERPAVCALCKTPDTAEPLGLIASRRGPCICRRCCELAWAVGWDSNPRFTTDGSRVSVHDDGSGACDECDPARGSICRDCGRPLDSICDGCARLADPAQVTLVGTSEMLLCRDHVHRYVAIFDDLGRRAAFGLRGSYADGQRLE